ncbi:3441_t:CDS:2 [Cetraspora pellucida]|uniref:3441_t:CDS:1 n=1 Tax=Cetraspora pellucida TaxID=1433469 RepID=A0A9N9JCU7_9GLOM|nr:3441_t:CDS:2 [Cetraspora pellucida]
MKISSAKRDFGLSETTFWHAVSNGGPPKRPGAPNVLTSHEENQLVGYCINMQKLVFGLTKWGVNYCVMEIMKLNKQSHLFEEDGPGQDWWERFMRDHPELSFCVPQNLLEARAQKVNKTIVDDHFKKLKQIINENSLAVAQIWNMNETGFVIVPKLEKVIAKKGTCQVHKIAYGNSHDHISVAPTISVAGSYIPPLIIYKGIRTIPGLLDRTLPETVMSFTSTGSHISYTIVDFCRNNEILLYALPPHTTHVLQPSEIPFAKLKKEYSKACEKYSNENDDMIVTKRTFAKVFGFTFLETYTPQAIYPSLVTERFDISPLSSQSSIQQAMPSLLAQKPTNSKHFHSTCSNVNQLIEENMKLKNENALLKSQISVANEELNTSKILEHPSYIRSDLPSPRKKRKTFPFSQLLTSEESWCQLEEVNREVECKADKAKQKKEIAAQKKAEQELRLVQKNEKRAQKTLGKQKDH